MRCVLVAAFLALGGCALTAEKIDVAYQPASGVAPIEGAGNVQVALQVNDVRTERDRVSSKTNGYGQKMGAISLNQDLTELVKDALEAELDVRGYSLAGNGIQLVCDIVDFNNEFRSGFWSGTAVGNVRFNVKIRSSEGNIIYTEMITGDGQEEGIQLASGKNAAPALERALQAAVAALMARSDFHAALAKAGGAAGGQPPPMPQTPGSE
ncbi:YajG family lipoprotein [Luteimonas sp. MJ204]|uniref:YajG family lipoprotein n=1 Tax=Luteimonas sp. MJ145 TaxID=3129234 RepID=UPI0031BB3D2D